MRAEQTYIVAYDIRDEKRLPKVHKAMLDFGMPRQYSVFECRLSDKNLVRMRFKLDGLIKHDEDQIIIFKVCERCRDELEVLGVPVVEDNPKVKII
jgi:CRISPR-associated protein Cas2